MPKKTLSRKKVSRAAKKKVFRPNVTADTLLKGAWDAADQCGYLLRHAAILHRAKAYPTAAAVALLGREELGAHRFLLDHWRAAVRTGTGPDAKALTTALHDHLLKQQRSNLTITYMHSGAEVSRRSPKGCLPLLRGARSIGKRAMNSTACCNGKQSGRPTSAFHSDARAVRGP